MTRVIAIANQKGGVAKTTTVHTLGAALVERGQRVLLVDLDPQACLTFSNGIDPDQLDRSLHDVMLGRADAVDALIKVGDLHVLPASIDLAGAEVHLLSKTGREFQLRRALKPLLESYDFILIDCPPSLGILTINGLTAATEVLVPLQCEALSQRGVGQLLETIADVRAYTNPNLVVLGVIATMYDSRTKLAQQVIDGVPLTYGLIVLQPPVPKSVKVAEAPSLGRSILQHAPSSRGAVAYRELAANLLQPGVSDPLAGGAGDLGGAGEVADIARSTVRKIDPAGRHALFSTPPQAARDQLGPGNQKDGRQAFFSTGPRQAGTVVVICSTCQTRTRVTLVDLGIRLLSISMWIPGRKDGHWMRCPGCHEHRWCQIAWND